MVLVSQKKQQIYSANRKITLSFSSCKKHSSSKWILFFIIRLAIKKKNI